MDEIDHAALVLAVRGVDPEMPQAIQPLGWLGTAVTMLKTPGTLLEAYIEDPDAWFEMVRELEWIHQNATRAIGRHGDS